ncbi:MAG: hypothetical protein ACHQT9_02265 [Candidatus Saccharimonadales bacterium]
MQEPNENPINSDEQNIAPVENVNPPDLSNGTTSTDPSAGTHIKIGPIAYILAAFGIVFVLSIVLPKSGFSQFLMFPIWILGGLAGLVFMYNSIKATQKTNNIALKTFIFLGGIGIGIVMFLIAFFIGAVIGVSNDPNPQSTG